MGPAVEQPQRASGVGFRFCRRPIPVVSVVVLVAALVLSSCGGTATVDLSDEAIVRRFLPWGDPASQDSIQRRAHAVVQDALTDCMVLRGFEYTPVPPEASGYGPGTGISREDFADRFGFGITTDDAYFEAAKEAMGNRDDLNDAYRHSLTQQEGKAYGEAYVSCMEEDIGPPPGYFQDIRRLEDSVRRTPEAAQAQDDWATCMVLEDGFASVRSLEELKGLLQVEYEESKNTPDALASLQESEIDMAVRNLECERELNNRLAVIASDLEQVFIDEHQEQIADQRTNLGE